MGMRMGGVGMIGDWGLGCVSFSLKYINLEYEAAEEER